MGYRCRGTSLVVLLLPPIVATRGRDGGRSRRRTGAMKLNICHECISGGAFGKIGETMFLVFEVRADAEEGLGVDIEDGDGVVELGLKTVEEIDDELLAGDGRADVTKSVGEDLQLVAVLRDGAVILE
jgi:hypothetical protein